MTDIPDILSDKRTIIRITSVFPGGGWREVGDYGITKIVPYEEHGWGSMVTWFAIYDEDDMIRWRVPAETFYVEYATPEAF